MFINYYKIIKIKRFKKPFFVLFLSKDILLRDNAHITAQTHKNENGRGRKALKKI